MSQGNVGKHGFIAKHYLWNADQRAAAKEIERRLQAQEIDTLRLSFVDQHGVLRGKSLTGLAMLGALSNACSVTTTLLLKDTSHRTVFPVWQAGAGLDSDSLTGAADVLMVPDPCSFQILPWTPRTAWMLCDLHYPNGAEVELSTRHIARTLLAELGASGLRYRSGLEIEFHIFRTLDPKLEPVHATMPGAPPEVQLVTQGYQYLTESRLDELEPVLEPIRSALMALGLPLRSLEVEFGPSQVELTFEPCDGLATADNTILARSAIKQVCARHGLHATFMCRPALENTASSGWHLHQSLMRAGDNAFTPSEAPAVLSPTGRHFVAGLLQHAGAACAFTTPTINGYKRFKSQSLAPERANWGNDNRGVMVRAISAPDDPNSRIENRVGEPSANPYLYLSAQLACGMHGMRAAIEPPDSTVTPYDDSAAELPKSLIESVDALAANAMFRDTLGDRFIDYFVTLKRAEINRFLSDVTDWEQREYFRLF